MKKLLRLLLQFLLLPQLLFSQFPANYEQSISWEYVGNPEFAAVKPNFSGFVITQQGYPVVAFKDNNFSGQVSVMKFDGATWDYIGNGGISPGSVFYVNLALGLNDQPYVVFNDGSSPGKASVMRFNGASWEYVGIPGFTSSQAAYPDIAINSSGVPYVAFVDHDPSFMQRLTVMKFDGTNWVYAGSPGFSSYVIGSTDIKFNPAGQPCIIYEDATNSLKITLMVFNGSNWINWGPAGPVVNSDNNVHFAIDPNGIPYVPYENSTPDGKLSVAKLVGSTWSTAGAQTLSSGMVTQMSVSISPSGTPHIAYCDLGGKVSVMSFDGTDWTFVGDEGFSPSAIYPVLAFHPSGQPYVAFVEGSLLSVMKYPSPSGISENNPIARKVFPNPCSNNITLELKEVCKSVQKVIEIFNLTGTCLYKTKTIEATIHFEVGNYPAGLYLIKVTSENSTWTGRFCKL